MIKNYPDLAFNIFKTDFKDNFFNSRGHLKFFDFPHSVLNPQKI